MGLLTADLSPINEIFCDQGKTDAIDALFYALADQIKDRKIIIHKGNTDHGCMSLAPPPQDSWEDSVFLMLVKTMRKVRELQLENADIKNRMQGQIKMLSSERDRYEKLIKDARGQIDSLVVSNKKLIDDFTILKGKQPANLDELLKANNDLLIENESLKSSNYHLKGVITRMKNKRKTKRKR
jgi:hypothetical protein